MPYLAYVHARPGTTTAAGIFYVGKGTRKRAYQMTTSRRNVHHNNVIKKHGAKNILVGTISCSSEEIALELECGLIKCLRRMGVEITNRTDGGDGLRNPSAETRAKIGAYSKNRVFSAKTRKKISEACKGRVPTENARRRTSEVFKGKKQPPEQVEKHRAKMLGRKLSPETCAKMSASRLGKKASPEAIAKRAASTRAVMATPEYKAKQSAILKAAWARRKAKQ